MHWPCIWLHMSCICCVFRFAILSLKSIKSVTQGNVHFCSFNAMQAPYIYTKQRLRSKRAKLCREKTSRKRMPLRCCLSLEHISDFIFIETYFYLSAFPCNNYTAPVLVPLLFVHEFRFVSWSPHKIFFDNIKANELEKVKTMNRALCMPEHFVLTFTFHSSCRTVTRFLCALCVMTISSMHCIFIVSLFRSFDSRPINFWSDWCPFINIHTNTYTIITTWPNRFQQKIKNKMAPSCSVHSMF